MKKKYKITSILFIVLSCILACETLFWGRIWNCVSCVVFLFFTILFLIHLYKVKCNSYIKPSKLFYIGIIFGFIMLISSPFVNGIIAYRPAYAYKNYYMSNRLNCEVFPETIPKNTTEIKFRVLGEGISRRVIYTLSFKTDENTLAELKQKAELLGYSISSGTIEDGIPQDVAPDFLKNEKIYSFTVYRINDEYGNESKIFISNNDTLICYFQE